MKKKVTTSQQVTQQTVVTTQAMTPQTTSEPLMQASYTQPVISQPLPPKIVQPHPTVAQKPIIVSSIPIVQVQKDNSGMLLAEIESLKSMLQQRDVLISQQDTQLRKLNNDHNKLIGDYQQLVNKIAMSGDNQISLSRELTELKQDKLDLKNDKDYLKKEIEEIRRVDAKKSLKLKQQSEELSKLRQIIKIDYNGDDSFISNLKYDNTEPNNIAIDNHIIFSGNKVHSISVNSPQKINNNKNVLPDKTLTSIILDDMPEVNLGGQNDKSEFSIIE